MKEIVEKDKRTSRLFDKEGNIIRPTEKAALDKLYRFGFGLYVKEIDKNLKVAEVVK